MVTVWLLYLGLVREVLRLVLYWIFNPFGCFVSNLKIQLFSAFNLCCSVHVLSLSSPAILAALGPCTIEKCLTRGNCSCFACLKLYRCCVYLRLSVFQHIGRHRCYKKSNRHNWSCWAQISAVSDVPGP